LITLRSASLITKIPSSVSAQAISAGLLRQNHILCYVFFHSIALACLVGIFVTLQAYAFPFTLMVVK